MPHLKEKKTTRCACLMPQKTTHRILNESTERLNYESSRFLNRLMAYFNRTKAAQLYGAIKNGIVLKCRNKIWPH